MLFRKMPCRCRQKSADYFPEHSEESYEKDHKSSSSHEDSKVHINGGRPKRYIRVAMPSYTEQSYL